MRKLRLSDVKRQRFGTVWVKSMVAGVTHQPLASSYQKLEAHFRDMSPCQILGRFYLQLWRGLANSNRWRGSSCRIETSELTSDNRRIVVFDPISNKYVSLHHAETGQWWLSGGYFEYFPSWPSILVSSAHDNLY